MNPKKITCIIGFCFALLFSGCSNAPKISEKAFCEIAANKIVRYKKDKGLTVIRTESGSIFLPNTSGFTIFRGMDTEITLMKELDPVKYYRLNSDNDVMNLCKIEVK